MNGRQQDHFVTTRWTMVLAAAEGGGGNSADALGELCEAYWFPLYAYVRHRGYPKEDAEDLTQAFFGKLLEDRMFAGADGAKGRFRAFLLASMKHFLANEREWRNAAKRGGSATHFSLDGESTDTKFGIADAEGRGPDEEFDRQWALTLLARVLDALGGEFSERGRSEEFAVLKGCLTEAREGISYGDMAERLGIDEGTARVRVHRLRKRYRNLLKDEISATLTDPAMADEELTVLLGAFR